MQNNLQMNWFFRGRGGRKTKEREEKEECRWGFCGGNFLRAFVRGGSILVTTREGQSMPGRRAYRDTALVRLPVIRGQLDPRLLEGELYHPTPFRHSGSEP